MADKDITGFSEFFDVWLPTRINQNVNPIVTQAEDTLEKSQSLVRQNLRNQLVPLITSLKGSQAKVLDTLSDKLSSSEAKLDDLHNTVINRLDTRLSPLESNASMVNVPPHIPVPGQETLPGGFTMLKPEVVFPSGSISPIQTGPGGIPTIGGIQNIPEQPPQQIQNAPPECPPVDGCPPCPPTPCPDDPYEFCIWSLKCKPESLICAYIIPRGLPPINSDDVLMGCINDPQGHPLAELWNQSNAFCNQHAPFCEPNPMGLPPKPIKPGGICCPPAQIQNIVGVPPGQIQNIQPPAGGQIQNIINLPNPIINEPISPVSPRPPISGFGQIVNDVILQIKDKLKWRPTGDFAYITDQDNDESGFDALWNELGISPKDGLGNNTIIGATSDAIKNQQVQANF